MPAQLNLLPQPRKLTLSGGALDLRASFIALEADPAADLHFAGIQAQAALNYDAGLMYEIVAGANESAQLTISLDAGIGHAQGYRLSITADGMRVAGADAAGAFYGVQTLIQLVQT